MHYKEKSIQTFTVETIKKNKRSKQFFTDNNDMIRAAFAILIVDIVV